MNSMLKELASTSKLVPKNNDLYCAKCQSKISDSRLRAIKSELELMGTSKKVCSDCHNREAVKSNLF